jgi:hypothetical protein
VAALVLGLKLDGVVDAGELHIHARDGLMSSTGWMKFSRVANGQGAPSGSIDPARSFQ